jgi:hypothetical protein
MQFSPTAFNPLFESADENSGLTIPKREQELNEFMQINQHGGEKTVSSCFSSFRAARTVHVSYGLFENTQELNMVLEMSEVKRESSL